MDDSVRYVDDVFSTDRPGIGVNLIYMLLEGILFFTLTLLIEVSYMCVYHIKYNVAVSICICTIIHRYERTCRVHIDVGLNFYGT